MNNIKTKTSRNKAQLQTLKNIANKSEVLPKRRIGSISEDGCFRKIQNLKIDRK
jgi:hypothetical protein